MGMLPVVGRRGAAVGKSLHLIVSLLRLASTAVYIPTPSIRTQPTCGSEPMVFITFSIFFSSTSTLINNYICISYTPFIVVQ